MRRSIGLGRTTPARVRSSSPSAPTLKGPSSIVRSRASGTPLRSQSGASSRAVRIAATGSASSRGRANRTIASDGASSHWTSSSASSSRLVAASFRNVFRKAIATTPSSAGGFSASEIDERGLERTTLRPRQLGQHAVQQRLRSGRPARRTRIGPRPRTSDRRARDSRAPRPLRWQRATASSCRSRPRRRPRRTPAACRALREDRRALRAPLLFRRRAERRLPRFSDGQSMTIRSSHTSWRRSSRRLSSGTSGP